MTAMHPDSGVPPNEARNSLPNDVEASVHCDELWYSTSRCQPRFDPAAANAMLAELITLINKGEVVYDCNRLDQVQYAVRYLIQRGLCVGTLLQAGPFDYICGLDPQCTRYNDFLTIIIIPNVTNQAAVRLNTDNLGLRQILRNDGQQLQSADLKAGIPTLISYWNGNWYVVGLVASQVPILSPALDFWIRTDGNDVTGDGTANDPAKAFRTIAGCWYAVGSRYAATPSFAINMRFGIPGDYEGASIGPFGGNVSLTGDVNNPAAYRVHCFDGDPVSAALWIQGVNLFIATGITVLMDYGTSKGATCALRCIESEVTFINGRLEVTASNAQGTLVDVVGGLFHSMNGSVTFEGNGNQLWSVFNVSGLGKCVGAYLTRSGQSCAYRFNNLNCIGAVFSLGGISYVFWNGATFVITNCIGPQYTVIENSILNMSGQPLVGSVAGGIGSGGRVIP